MPAMTALTLPLLCAALAATPEPAVVSPSAPTLVHHDLAVTLDPATHGISVVDRITLPPGEGPVELVLNGALRITRSEPTAKEVPLGDLKVFLGINGTNEAKPLPKRYRVTPRKGERSLRVEYQGRFDFGLSAAKEEYTRGMRETMLRGIAHARRRGRPHVAVQHLTTALFLSKQPEPPQFALRT